MIEATAAAAIQVWYMGSGQSEWSFFIVSLFLISLHGCERKNITAPRLTQGHLTLVLYNSISVCILYSALVFLFV